MPAYSLLAAFVLVNGISEPLPQAIEVRVAIVAYEDFQSEIREFERLFASLSQQDPALRFRLAVGSYADVLHWLDRRFVDVAVLTPGEFSGLLPEDGSKPRGCNYLATIRLPAAQSSWASQERRQPGHHVSYNSICLVSKESNLRSLKDVVEQIQKDRIELLFVHPLSMSGHIAPREAFRQLGIDLHSIPQRFSYSHSESIRMLNVGRSQRHRVAFVWDDAAGNDTGLENGVRRIPFPELDRLSIPHDVVVARNGFDAEHRLKTLLLSGLDQDSHFRFVHTPDWESRYRVSLDWWKPRASQSEEGQATSLNEIGQLLLQYSRSSPHPPRLALVLSGGGAKCSYQLGAVAALEEKLNELRQDHPGHPLDIALVVGTSGGAINALPVALGITRSDEGRAAFRDTWSELDQRDIVRPSWRIRLNMGLWFALIQTLVLVRVMRWWTVGRENWEYPVAAALAGLAGIEILLGYLPLTPWSWLGTNHLLHHAWLWLSFGVRASAWSLLSLAIITVSLAVIRKIRGRGVTFPKRPIRALVWGGLIGLPLLQILTILTVEETLSGGQGMEEALARKYPRLINRHLLQQRQLPVDFDDTNPTNETLRSVSCQVIRRQLLARDLVITGSCLEQTSRDLPSDLYFFALAQPSVTSAPFDNRGVSLVDHPEILLDVIMGSGSIFPVFPARKIKGLPRPHEQIELIDGGFAHNSPIEAAVLWGATHIILIDVVPRGHYQRGNFLWNATSSIRHLHRQAQLIDTRSRGKVTIFTLSPEPPHICIIDFARNLVESSVDRGYQDAKRDAEEGNLQFRRECGQPVFSEVLPDPTSEGSSQK